MCLIAYAVPGIVLLVVLVLRWAFFGFGKVKGACFGLYYLRDRIDERRHEIKYHALCYAMRERVTWTQVSESWSRVAQGRRAYYMIASTTRNNVSNLNKRSSSYLSNVTILRTKTRSQTDYFRSYDSCQGLQH